MRTAASARAPAGATLGRTCANQSGATTMPPFGPHPVHGARRGRRLVHVARQVGDSIVRRARSGARTDYAEEGFPLTKRGAWFFARASRDVLALRAHGHRRRVRRRCAPATGCASPRWRRTIRTLADDGPDAYYRGPIGAAIAERLQQAGGCMTVADFAAHAGEWVEPLRRAVPRRRDPRDAAADAGRHRARGVAHRRRSRPRRRRSGSRAPPHRGDEARVRRPSPVRRRSATR